ncbi:MAG: hypothetical protein F6J90_20670 [Moorea sp. SIOASIH]|nr:hypothetical protein [Moorena sp. SIOASIH]
MSAVSSQQSAVSSQPNAEVTEIKAMFTCCLDAARSWGKPRQLLMGGTPFGGTASPRPRCIAYSKASQVVCA